MASIVVAAAGRTSYKSARHSPELNLRARQVERVYRDLEAAGYSRSTLRTLDLVLAKAFAEQTGRRLGAHKPSIGPSRSCR